MVTTRNLTSLDRLLRGEKKVKCNKCNKGFFIPFNPEAKINHYYYCNYCGHHLHWDPVVNIE